MQVGLDSQPAGMVPDAGVGETAPPAVARAPQATVTVPVRCARSVGSAAPWHWVQMTGVERTLAVLS